MKSPDRLDNESGQVQQALPNLTKCRTPRYCRALRALAAGPVMREELDRASGSSNGPDVVAALVRAGWRIECERLNRIDRDGRPCKPGRYTLQANQRDIAAQFANDWLSGAT